jgi:hypothetical protein
MSIVRRAVTAFVGLPAIAGARPADTHILSLTVSGGLASRQLARTVF